MGPPLQSGRQDGVFRPRSHFLLADIDAHTLCGINLNLYPYITMLMAE